MVKILKSSFGKTIDPLTLKTVEVYRYTMTNNNNMSVSVITLGATIQSIQYPDKYGNVEDVCLGFDSLKDYIYYKNKLIGATVGRVANRVAEGKFSMDGNEYIVKKNLNNKHQINGGFIGFDCMIWQVIKEHSNGIIMQHVSIHGFEGYPGKLTTKIEFTLDDNNKLGICIISKTNKKTPVNIANYLFLNLAGHNSRKEALFQHNIMLKSRQIVDCDHEQIPNGSLRPVKYTLYDLRKYVNLGKRLKKFFNHPIKGFDNHYCIDAVGNLVPVCKIIHPCTGRWLEFSSTQPAVHFLTCNDWPDIEQAGIEPIVGKNGAIYAQYGAFCLSAQQYPDAMNHTNFPNIFLKRKQKYCQKSEYLFGCAD